MDLQLAVGLGERGAAISQDERREVRRLAEGLLGRAAGGARCPADRRIEGYLATHFADLAGQAPLRLPAALVLPRHGVAREVSLPADGDTFRNEYLTSHRVLNGVLHNPKSDRRTTSGTFHVCE